MANELVDENVVRELLRDARTIAILGAHHDTWKPAFYVPDYLLEQGYEIIPVNPRFAGQEFWGQPVRALLSEIEVAVDIVDVFRRSDALMAHLDEILAMSPRPRAVWLQLGIRNDAFRDELVAAGIDVVQDRCTLADHRRWRLPRVVPV